MGIWGSQRSRNSSQAHYPYNSYANIGIWEFGEVGAQATLPETGLHLPNSSVIVAHNPHPQSLFSCKNENMYDKA